MVLLPWRIKNLVSSLILFVIIAMTGALAQAAAPAASAFTGVTLSQIQANWTANGNPGGSTYVVILSTGPNPPTNGFSGNQSSTTIDVSAVFSGLAQNTT